jgi:hypothetical protein
MDDSERYKLLYGPYVPPKCHMGDKLACEHRGREVTVRRMTDARIQWPATHGGPPSTVIVCGDLIRAVRVESAIAVAFHWGVSPHTVRRWRRALDVPRSTNGTRRLAIDYVAEKLTPEVRAKAKHSMHSAEVRARLRASHVGRPTHPNFRAAQREYARRPKPEAWKRALSARMGKMWENPEAHGRPARHHWTDDEIALLGTQSDGALAKLLRLPTHVVSAQRRRLGIRRIAPRWAAAQIALLGTATDAEVGRKLGKTVGAVRTKRLQLRIPSFAAHWTAEEIAMLGTDTDPQIARRLGRTTIAVYEKRTSLEIDSVIQRWSEEEESWLGTDSDSVVAEALGRTAEAVRVRRNKRGIVAWRGE